MQILHVTQAVGGGVSRHLVDIASGVNEAVHHAVLPSPWESAGPSGSAYDSRALDELRDHGAHIHHLPLTRKVINPSNLAGALKLRSLIKDLRPDVIHSHSAIGGAVARLAAMGTEVPVVHTPNGILAASLSLTAERSFRPLTSRIVAVSKSEAQNMLEWRLCEPERLVLIRNGIDLQPSTPGPDIRTLVGLPAETPLIGTIMRLIPQKAPEQFVAVAEAIKRIRPDAHFLLIGMGPLQDRVDAELNARDLVGNFHQIPHLDDAAGVLDQLDVFVLASRFEGAPYAPLEAIRARTPVVLSDVVGNADVVEDGVSGRLIPFGQSETMAKAVVELLEDPNLAGEVTVAALRRLEDQFDVRKMCAAIGALYEEVVAEGRRCKTRRLPQLKPSTSVHSFDSSAA